MNHQHLISTKVSITRGGRPMAYCNSRWRSLTGAEKPGACFGVIELADCTRQTRKQTKPGQTASNV